MQEIRILDKCEGWIEKSVPRVTVWHHDASWMTPDCNPEDIFFSFLHTLSFLNVDFCITCVACRHTGIMLPVSVVVEVIVVGIVATISTQ